MAVAVEDGLEIATEGAADVDVVSKSYMIVVVRGHCRGQVVPVFGRVDEVGVFLAAVGDGDAGVAVSELHTGRGVSVVVEMVEVAAGEREGAFFAFLEDLDGAVVDGEAQREISGVADGRDDEIDVLGFGTKGQGRVETQCARRVAGACNRRHTPLVGAVFGGDGSPHRFVGDDLDCAELGAADVGAGFEMQQGADVLELECVVVGFGSHNTMDYLSAAVGGVGFLLRQGKGDVVGIGDAGNVGRIGGEVFSADSIGAFGVDGCAMAVAVAYGNSEGTVVDAY